MARLLRPDLYLSSITELTPDRLAAWSVRSLLLDVDGTLGRYGAARVLPKVEAWLVGMRAAGVGLCLVSNARAGRIARLAAELQLPFVAWALKPLPMACRRAMRRLGFVRAETAIVGDQLFADVLAGRLCGLRCVLVRPIHPEDEPWVIRIRRPLERWLLRHVQPIGETPPAPVAPVGTDLPAGKRAETP